MRYAIRSENTASLKVLLEAGVEWERKAARAAAFEGNVDALRVALDHVEPESWDLYMIFGFFSAACIQVMYEKGY
jgi:hypothetical protein